MKKFNIILFGLLILSISLVSGAMQSVAAQVSPVTVLEDNPDRLNDDGVNKVLVPDPGAAGAVANGSAADAAALPGADDAAGNEVRIENVPPAATLGDDALDEDDGIDDRRGRNGRNRGGDKILEIRSMVSNEEFNTDVFGVQGSEDAMSIESGKASLDSDMNLEVRVKGLRFLDADSSGEARFSAGVACMDSGYVKASGKNADSGDDFALDDNGDGRFEGHVDFQGASCVAPTVMVVNENGEWVAIAGHSAATDDDDNQGNDDQGNDDRNDDDDFDNDDPDDDNDQDDNDDLDDNDQDGDDQGNRGRR